MNFRHRTYKLTILCGILVAMLYHSCTDDLGLVENCPSDVVCFTASLHENTESSTRGTSGHLDIVEEEWKLDMENKNTRATLVTQLSGFAGIYGYNGESMLNGLKNVSYTFTGDELNSTDTPIYWKNIEGTLETMDIYAYAPYSLNLPGKTFNYQIPSVAEQQDMIVAKAVLPQNSFRHTVPLTFEHTLTAIRFKLGFTCTLQSIKITGVRNKGTYTIGGEWSGQEGTAEYVITNKDDLLILLPQTLPDNAKVLLTYDDNGTSKTLSASLRGQVWKPGKLITYTLYEGDAPDYIYFDLAAGNVDIDATQYTGSIYVEGEVKEVKGTHDDNNRYYVYQSTTLTDQQFAKFNKDNTGYANISDYEKMENCRIPNYDPISCENKSWGEYITNNTNEENVD